VIEACAAGRPVVVTTGCALSDVVATSGSGLVVKPDDVEALAAAIEVLVNDPQKRAKMGIRGRMLASDRYGMSEIIDELEYAYHEALLAP
jgi:glycosyltransferase involved in cell wall biosynthesis